MGATEWLHKDKVLINEQGEKPISHVCEDWECCTGFGKKRDGNFVPRSIADDLDAESVQAGYVLNRHLPMTPNGNPQFMINTVRPD